MPFKFNPTTGKLDLVNSSAGGATTFTSLTDVPASYTGQGGKVVAVKTDVTGLEFISVGGTGDMTKAVYDPTAKNADAFSMGNMVETAGAKIMTAAERTNLGNQSGTNTGDNAVNSLYSGLAASKQDTLVSGTNIKTINGNSLLGAGNLVISGSGGTITEVDVDFGNTAVDDKEFIITDVSCSPTSKILASVAYKDTTNNSADEVSMSKIVCSAGLPEAGQFTLSVIASDGPISGIIKVQYTLA